MDRVGQSIAREIRIVGVVGVLNKHPVRREGQHIDESIPVGLRDGGVHDDGVFKVVGLGQLDFQAQELLKTERKVRGWRRAPTVKNNRGHEAPAVGQRNTCLIDRADLGVGKHVEALGVAQHAVKLFRRRGTVSGGKSTGSFWKPDLLA